MVKENQGAHAVLALPLAAELTMELVWCPAGEFVMGAEGDKLASWVEAPAHKVSLTKGFWIARTLITQQQWTEVMKARQRLFSSSSEALLFPAEGMSWDEALDFCRQWTASLQEQGHLDPDHEIDLPSEAEWEYACRAGTTAPWHFGDDASVLGNYGWYRDNSNDAKHPVALKQPNPWGLYDLYGNVAEWCRDDFYKYEDQEECDPDHFDHNGLVKMTRGGDFSSPSGECRSASRASANRDNPFNEAIGLRIVCREIGRP